MKVLFVFKVFVFLNTNALATVHEDRFISAEFVVNSVFIYDQAMVHVIVSFAIFRHDITTPRPFQKALCHSVFLPLRGLLFATTESGTNRHPRSAPGGDRQTPCCP